MPRVNIQIPSIILPVVWANFTEEETLNDLLEHTSAELILTGTSTFTVSGYPPFRYLQEKMVNVTATEVGAAAGALLVWIELSPNNTAETTALGITAKWAAIGGGGGALAPTVPHIEAATGVAGTVHNFFLPWTVHSEYARAVAQMPVCALPLANHWTIQMQFSGKGF